jgi:putative hydrolase of the HAD superfamily
MKDLIADLDGTIVTCGRYYSEACQDVTTRIAEKYQVEATLVRELIDHLDIWAIRANQVDGFRKERFPRSLAAAVAAVQYIAHGEVTLEDCEWAYHRANQVFSALYEPFPGAIDTLRSYKDAGWRVWILTKGDPDVQNPKIYKNGLDTVVTGWEVVPRKNVDILRTFCEQRGIDITTAVYVGDSVRDDMQSAAKVGMQAIRVETDPQDNWVHEQIEDPWSNAVILTLKDLPSVVPQ